MSVATRLRDTLARCEADLQKIAAEALAAGDYDSARRGLELAESLADQRQRAGLSDVKDNRPRPVRESRTASAERSARPPTNRPTVAAKVVAYPQFVREGDKLVKIGWSKRSKEEYTHKAPRSAVDALVAHLRTHTRDGRLFTIDDLLPVPDPENAIDLPAYQIYLGIAWLRTLGVLHKHGRDGYSVEHDDIGEKPLALAWKQLPSPNL